MVMLRSQWVVEILGHGDVKVRITDCDLKQDYFELAGSLTQIIRSYHFDLVHCDLHVIPGNEPTCFRFDGKSTKESRFQVKVIPHSTPNFFYTCKIWEICYLYRLDILVQTANFQVAT